MLTNKLRLTNNECCHCLGSGECWSHIASRIGGTSSFGIGDSNSASNMNVTDFSDGKPVIISAVMVMNIIANSIVIAVIAKYPQLREDRSTLFMFSLALSDLSNGCTAMPIGIALCSRATPNVRNMTGFLPKIHGVFSLWFTACSMHSLCWMTVCKLIAITKPFRYEQLLTRKRCYFIICCTWMTGALLAATVTPYVSTWDLDVCMFRMIVRPASAGILIIVIIIAVVLPVVVLVYSSTRIFVVIIRTHRQIAAQVNLIGGEASSAAGVASLTLKSVRSGRNVLVVSLSFFLMTIPFIIHIFLSAFKLDVYVPTSSTFVASWILLSNSSVNSIIYVYLFRDVRLKTSHMLRSVCNCFYS